MPAGTFSQSKKTWFSIDKDNGKIKSKDRDKNIVHHDFLIGFLKSVTFEEGEYEGRPANKYVVTLESRDGSETDVLRMGEDSNCAYDTLNRLANVEGKFGEVKFTPYFSEFNGKNIAHMSIQHNRVKIQGKYKPDEIPKPNVVKVGKQEVRDLSEKQEFFKKLSNEINQRLQAQYGVEQGLPADLEPGDDEEIPF